jgi:uncharacterized membrane protein HdeD (DUF308 family)
MKRLQFYLLTAFLLSVGTSAHATPPETSSAAATVGDALKNLITDVWNPILLVITMGAGIAGIFLLIRGLVKMASAAQDRGNGSYGSAIAYILCAALLIALPESSGMGMTTLFGDSGRSTLQTAGLDYDDNGISNDLLSALTGGTAAVGGVNNCLTADQPAVCMSSNIARNVIPMAVMALFALTFLAGLIIAGTTILQWAKSTDRGQGDGKSYLTRIVAAILLMNASVLFRIATKTAMGQDSPVSDLGHMVDASSPLLAYKTTSTNTVFVAYSQLLSNAFVILVFFGAWAFVRGVFMFKGVSEGKQQGSYGMAFTYTIAGIMLANAKFSTCLILGTVGGVDAAVDFCT